jgi:3-deoxy-D-manno-octulosonic acid (KDO) 8-phosphate synthase
MTILSDQIYSESGQFFLIAGPCVLENEEMGFPIAETLLGLCDSLDIPLIFKASYRKANRSRLDSFTGIGDQRALEILQAIGEAYMFCDYRYPQPGRGKAGSTLCRYAPDTGLSVQAN